MLLGGILEAAIYADYMTNTKNLLSIKRGNSEPDNSGLFRLVYETPGSNSTFIIHFGPSM